MVAVAFHFNVPHRLNYTCRLLRKAVAAGARLQVLGPDSALSELDERLWDLSPTDFLTHCDRMADGSLRKRSSILLGQTGDDEAGERDVLVNLDPAPPLRMQAYARIIEVVGLAEPEREEARRKWRFYASHGLTPQRHDLARQESE